MSNLSSLINQESENLAKCQIRLARDTDEAAIRAFLRRSRHSFQHLIHSDPDTDLSGIDAFYNNRDGFIFILEVEDRIVGTIGLFAVDEFLCEVRKFYLAPEMANNGLGRNLLSTVIRIAKARGFRNMQTETMPGMTSAYAMYARFGFYPSKESHAPHLNGGRMLTRSLQTDLENAENEAKQERAC